MKYLLLVFASLFLLLSISVSADNLIQNGDFSSGYFPNIAQCVFVPEQFFVVQTSCTQSNTTTTQQLPTIWTDPPSGLPFDTQDNVPFDTLRIHTNATFCAPLGVNCPFPQWAFMYSTSLAGEFFNYASQSSRCGYNQQPDYACSGIATAGNDSKPSTILQNFTLPNSSYVLSFNYWFPFATGNKWSNNLKELVETAYDGRNGYYNCANPSTSFLGGNCSYQSFLAVRLLNATTLWPGTPAIFTDFLSAPTAGNLLQFYSRDLTGLNLAPGKYTLWISAGTLGPTNNETASMTDVANISVSIITFPTQFSTGNNYITDVNTVTNVGIENANSTNATSGIFYFVNFGCPLCYARVSRNFSDFYKFDLNFTVGDTLGFNPVQGQQSALNITGFDSSGNQYTFPMTKTAVGANCDGIYCDEDNPNIIVNYTMAGANGACAVPAKQNITVRIFGYMPSNVTKIQWNHNSNPDCGIGQFYVNVSLGSASLTSRNSHKWFLPIARDDNNEFSFENYPLFFYGFNFNSSNKNVTFTVYNFRNTSSFGVSSNLNNGEGSAVNNIYLLSGSQVIAFSTESRAYNQEYTNDFTSIVSDNNANVGDSILVNRTSLYAFFNNNHTTDKSTFLISIFAPPSAGGGGGTPQQPPCVFGSLCPSNSNQTFNFTTGTAFDPVISMLVALPFWYFVLTFFGTLAAVWKLAPDDNDKGQIVFGAMIGFSLFGLFFGIYAGLVGISIGAGLAALFAFLFWFSLKSGMGAGGG